MREIPPSYTGRVPLPVVIDLHGWSEPASFQVQVSQLGAYGATHRFITITPQVAEPALVWRLGLHGRDVAFMGALLHTVDTTLCVDRNRVFVTGYSWGAFLTSSLVCVYASQIAAVAPVAGIQDPAGCRPSRPVPVVAFHGTADPFVPYDGEVGKAALKLEAPDGSHRTLGQVLGKKAAKIKGPTIPQNAAAWARRNGCAPTPSDRKVASDVTLITYACPKGDDVELYRVSGGGHAWPGSAVTQGDRVGRRLHHHGDLGRPDHVVLLCGASAAPLSITAAALSCHPRARAARAGRTVRAAACAAPPGPRPRARG